MYNFFLRSCRCRLAVAMILPLLLTLLVSCRDQNNNSTAASPAGSQQPTGPAQLLFPATGAYTGAYVEFGEGESHVTYDALTKFEGLTGKSLAVVAFGNFWGDQEFPEKTLHIIANYGAVPLLFWSPWDKPYNEGRAPDRFALPEILAGKWDAYIDAWADAAKKYGKPMLVAWGIEMNGNWFPWSGFFYDGRRVIGHEKDGRPIYYGPDLFKRAYRHVVDRVRARQATNILWGFHANNLSSPDAPWNKMANYYPGPDYVDWLGLSVYGKLDRTDSWGTFDFDQMMTRAYGQICEIDPKKPLFLAEWGVGEFPPGDKAGFIAQAFRQIPVQYPRVKVAVYWHERWENPDGSYSNLRVNSSPEAKEAYRAGVASPYWVGRPQFAPRPAP